MGSHYSVLFNNSNQCSRFKKNKFLKKYFLTMASEVEETLKRLVGHKGVIATVVVNKDGACIKSTLEPSISNQYSNILGSLINQATTMFREMDPSNDVTFMRVRTKKCQFMVVPDNEYLFIVVQNNTE